MRLYFIGLFIRIVLFRFVKRVERTHGINKYLSGIHFFVDISHMTRHTMHIPPNLNCGVFQHSGRNSLSLPITTELLCKVIGKVLELSAACA